MFLPKDPVTIVMGWIHLINNQDDTCLKINIGHIGDDVENVPYDVNFSYIIKDSLWS